VLTSTWKAVERRTARVLGGHRIGPTGRDGPDVVTSWLAVECKHRKLLPLWLTETVAKIRQQAGRDKLGMVVLHEHGRHDSLVVLSMADFRQWFGNIEGEDNGQ